MLCPRGSTGDVTDHSSSSPWGVTLITKDQSFYLPWILLGIKERGCFPSWATQKKNEFGEKSHLWSEETISVGLATFSSAVGRVGCECYGDTPTYTEYPPINLSVVYDLYPVLEVSHTWNLEGKPGPPVDTLASQPVSLDSRKRAQHQCILPRFMWDKVVFVGALVLLLGKGGGRLD